MENNKKPSATSNVRLSKKSWHYRLQCYVFGKSNVPKLYNLCPYFWLTFFCIIITIPLPFVPFFKMIGFIVGLINKFVAFMGKGLYNKWLKNLDVSIIEDITQIGHSYNLKVPKYFDTSYSKIAEDWAKIQKLDLNTESGKKTFQQMLDNYKAKRKILEERKREMKLNHEMKKSRMREKRDNFQDSMSHMFDKVDNAIDNWKKWKRNIAKNHALIIKLTKTFMGIIMTLIVTFVAFWVVYGIILLLAAIIAALGSIPSAVFQWILYIFVLVVLVIALAIVFILYIESLHMKIKNKELPIYLLAAKYLIFYPVFYIIYVPLRFIWEQIIVEFSWRTVIIPILRGIALVVTSFVSFLAKFFVLFLRILFVDGFGGFFQIFAEYFGKANGDFCKGLEWDDEQPGEIKHPS